MNLNDYAHTLGICFVQQKNYFYYTTGEKKILCHRQTGTS